jgi:hypothetical protein
MVFTLDPITIEGASELAMLKEERTRSGDVE